METNGFISCSLPTREGLAAWAAAAGTAGAVLPGVIAQVLSQSHNWDEHGDADSVDDVEDLWDAYSVLEAVASACRHVYRQDPHHYPMPRGVELCVAPDGRVGLLWRSDSHTVALHFGGGWSSADLDRGGPGQRPHWAPNMSEALLTIEGSSLDALRASQRTAAALAASPTLQEQGWSSGTYS